MGLHTVGQLDDLLCATHVGQGKAHHQAAFGNEVALQIARHLKDGNGAFLHKASDTRAYTRLEVGVQLIALNHIEGNGAMGEEQLTRLRVDGGRIGQEA